ncbi:protein RhsA [Salmonella enterica subsp. enterica]|nr:protein RhsA [Salmonella enterica subsp. enterica]
MLTTQAQRAEAAQAAYATAGTSRSAFADFPETLPATEYGTDNGIRLSQVWLTYEPDAEGDLEPVMLSRYEYTPCGELAAVYDRGGMEVRRFLYDAEHPGRMTGHRYAGRPQMRYRYNRDGQVEEQLNPEGLSYRYAYEKNQVAVTDSLGRREVLHTEGEGGLKRVVMKASADGSVTRSEYDPAGRLKAQTDAAGRRTEYSLHMASGRVTAVTYGSGYLAGMKLGDTPLVEYTRDRLHREVLRRFGAGAVPEAGAYELTTTYTPGGQLHGQHLTQPQLNREYGYDEGGRLVRISGPQQTREYRYSESGRLTGVHTSAANLDITLPYATDPAGNRLPDPEFYPESSSRVWADNRITEDMQYLYRYDKYGRLTEKTDRIPEGVIRMNDERTHRYEYDNQHRLVHYVRTQHGETQAEGRYVYDPLGRRVGKRVWRWERSLAGYMALAKKAEVTWYGWEGDRLTTIQTGQSRVQTVYAPGSFTPLVRIETDTAEQAKAQHRSLAEKLSQEGSEDGQAVQLPAALTAMLDRLEGELRRNAVSEESRAWLAGCGLTPEQMAEQLEPEYTPQRKIHLYHCDQRGLPLALITPDNTVAWRGEYDEWGNLSGEENPADLEQVIRLPGQQYDEESGLYYNRHRYYNPGQGRYITQDPIGLKGGWNPYTYPLNSVVNIDPLGLKSCSERIVEAANELNDDPKYSYVSAYGFGDHTNKCNLFVSDVLKKADVEPPERDRQWLFFGGGPITAGTWADTNKDIPGFDIVSQPRPGDVVAISYDYSDATGHVAIVSDSDETIGAGENGSHSTDWPWNKERSPQGTPVYRRCKE